MLCAGPLVPLEEKLSAAAARGPSPEGVNRTVIAQLPPTATDVHVFPVSAYSAVLPEIAAPETVSGPLPVFVMVKTLEAETA